MKFVKMHGLGNDYIYLDCFRQSAPEDPNALAIHMSRPHFGIGSDGLVLILPSEIADARMRMFNADGSEGPHVRKRAPLRREIPVRFRAGPQKSHHRGDALRHQDRGHAGGKRRRRGRALRRGAA